MWTGLVCVAALACGVNVGWRPRTEGGMEYLIQIEPYSLDSLRAGTAIESDIPPSVKDIRSFTITVGTKTLPQLPAPATAAAAAPLLNAPTLPPTDARSAPKLPPAPDMSPLPLPKRMEEKPADQKPADKATSSTLWQTNPSTRQEPSTGPMSLLPESSSRPLAEQHAAYLQPTASPPPVSPSHSSSQPQSLQPQSQQAPAESQPGSWFYPFVFAMVALAGSVSWNGFLVWSLGEARRRYRELQDYRDRRGHRSTPDRDPSEATLDEEIENEDQENQVESPRRPEDYGGKSRDPKRR